jgi:WhiB family redox-sensing transcriptional regulator
MVNFARLPGPVADKWQWQLAAACRQADPRLFFRSNQERGPARRRREAAAVAVCASCPVMHQCRTHALSIRENDGVWGGLTEDELKRARKG